MQKLLFLILSSISQGSTDNENSSLGRKIRSHGGEGESDYNPYDSPMFQFIQDLTEEEISDLTVETLWDISQFYKNNPIFEPPPWFTDKTTGSTTTATTADTTTSLSRSIWAWYLSLSQSCRWPWIILRHGWTLTLQRRQLRQLPYNHPHQHS